MTLAADDQKNHSIARPSNADYTVIVWEDYRNGTDADIYAQMIDNTNGIAVWFPIDGVPVCTAGGEQRNPRAAYDSLGGVIITWEDSRTDLSAPYDPASNLSEIYAARLDLATGYQDQNWGGAPVPVCAVPYSRTLNPRIVGINDGAVITWTDYRNEQTTGADVYAQYIMSVTGIYPAGMTWIANGVQVNNLYTDYDQRNPEIVLDSIRYSQQLPKFGVVIAYECEIDGAYKICVDPLVYTGANPWGSGSDLLVAVPTSPNYTPDHQFHHRMTTLVGNGNTGDTATVAIVWEDYRDYGTQGIDIYAQRIDVENRLQRWPVSGGAYDGICVCSAENDQEHPKIDVGEGFATIAWEDGRTQQDLDIYANRLDAFCGTPISPFGEEICTEAEDQLNVEVEYGPDESLEGRATICWEDHRPIDYSDIYVQELDPETWNLYWPTNGQAVTEAKEDQLRPEVGHRVFVYTDERRVQIIDDTQEDANIYAQKIGDDCDDPTKMHWKDILAEWTPNVSAQDHRFTVDEDGNTYVVWYEDRTVPLYQLNKQGVYIQKLDKDGVPRWGNDGILLSDSTLPNGKPDVCIGGAGSAIATWYETENGTDRIVVSKVLSDGSIDWTAYAAPTPGTNPRIVEDENGGAFVAFENTGVDIYTCWFDNAGTRRFARILSNFGRTNTNPLIVRNRNAGCYVVGNNGSYIDFAWYDIIGRIRRGSSLTFPNITSYDLAIDNRTSSGGYYDGLLAVSDGSGIYLKKIHVNALGYPLLVPSANVYAAGTSTPPDIVTNPVIDADSLAVTDFGTGGGGAIVAWDRAYLSGATHLHTVRTCDYDWWPALFPPEVRPRYAAGWPIDISIACMENTTPDIVYENKRDRLLNYQNNPSTFGYVVWHEYGERSCEYKAVVAQEIDYNLDSTYSPTPEPRQWYVNGELISPHSGIVEQCIPVVHAGMGDSAAVYWLDTRAGNLQTGNPIVVGTQLCSRSGSMLLSKRNAETKTEFPTEAILYQNYPNPVAVNGSASIGYYLDRESYVVFTVYDLLGRAVIVNDRGREMRGYHATQFSTRGLMPGMYVYALNMSGRTLSRQLIIVR